MKRHIAALTLACWALGATGFAQNPSPPTPAAARQLGPPGQAPPPADKSAWEIRIVPVRHAEVNAVRAALQWFNADVSAQAELKVLSVRAPKEIMPAIVEAITKLDESVSQSQARNIEIVVHVLIGAETAPAGTRPVPASVQPVVDQLKTLLAYKTYSIADTLFLNATEKQTISSNGNWPEGLNLSAGLPPPRYSFKTTPFLQGANKVVRLENLFLRMDGSLEGPNKSWSTSYNAVIETNADVPEGKQVVVGKTAVGDRAYILVVSARVLD
jgi:hypothetical protein